MARNKHNEAEEAPAMDNGNGGEYQLQKGRWQAVDSNVYTLKFPVADGKDFVVDRELLKDGVNKDGSAKYKYRRGHWVPQINTNGVTIDNLAEVVAQFAHDIASYDGASTILNESGSKSMSRPCTIAEDTEGKPIEIGQYIVGLLEEAHKLNLQKRWYKPLREKAIEDFRQAGDPNGERDLSAPAKSARVRKVKAQDDVEPEME